MQVPSFARLTDARRRHAAARDMAVSAGHAKKRADRLRDDADARGHSAAEHSRATSLRAQRYVESGH